MPTKKFCPYCGGAIESSDVFCPNCGADLRERTSTYENTYTRSETPYETRTTDITRRVEGIEQRSIPMYVILSIVTCGIFGLYWLYHLNEDLNMLVPDENNYSGAMVVLLSLVTCGIFLIYWSYKAGKRVERLTRDTDAAILYLVLTLFGLSIVTYAMIQDAINKTA